MWNKQSAKKILEKKQKTYQYSKHLQTLIQSKSMLDLTSPWKKSMKLSTDRSKKNSYEKSKINYQNTILLTHISQINNKQKKSFPKQNKFTLLSQSLSNITALNRYRNSKNIGKQNKNLYDRLVSTSPSIKRQYFVKSMQSQMKYRNNILKSRSKNPDYAVLASSFLSRKYKEQLMRGSQQSFPKLNKKKIGEYFKRMQEREV